MVIVVVLKKFDEGSIQHEIFQPFYAESVEVLINTNDFFGLLIIANLISAPQLVAGQVDEFGGLDAEHLFGADERAQAELQIGEGHAHLLGAQRSTLTDFPCCQILLQTGLEESRLWPSLFLRVLSNFHEILLVKFPQVS